MNALNGGYWLYGPSGYRKIEKEYFGGVVVDDHVFKDPATFQWVMENCPNIKTLRVDTSEFKNDTCFLKDKKTNDWIHKIDHIQFGDREDYLGDEQRFLNFCRLAKEAAWYLPNVTRLSISTEGKYERDEYKSESESEFFEDFFEDESESESESESDENKSESESDSSGEDWKHPYSFGDDLVDFIQTCLPNLTSISLDYIVINEDGKQCIAKCIEASPKLEAVYLARVVMEGEENSEHPRPLTADAINTFVGSVKSQKQVFEFTYFCQTGRGYTVLLPFQDFDDSTHSTWVYHLNVINVKIERENANMDYIDYSFCEEGWNDMDSLHTDYDHQNKRFRTTPLSVTWACRVSDRKTKVCRNGTMYGGEFMRGNFEKEDEYEEKMILQGLAGYDNVADENNN